MEKIIGLIDAPFTPFYENGEVNYEPIEAYAKMLQKNGLKGVFINGSSGEGYMLTEDERMKLAERWMEVAPEGFKVIVHVGSCCVKASRMLAEHAQKMGAWGPPFPKIGRIEELVKYCEEIAAGAPDLPFYYYHIPAFNGAFLPMTELLKAVDGRIPNFAGIKYTYESLYEYIFSKYENILLIDKNNFYVDDYFYDGEIYVKQSFSYPLTETEKKLTETVVNIYKLDNYKNNDKVGEVSVLLNDKELYKENIYIRTKEKKEQNIFSKIVSFFKGLFNL